MKKSLKGFTLIELLVVVAIIGILAAVILASLASARGKARDARVKSEMASIRNQAELYYSEHGSYNSGYPHSYAGSDESMCGSSYYGGVFGSGNTQSAFALLRDAAYISSGGQWGTARCFVGAGGETYAALVPLSSGGFWCVDSNGASRATTMQSLSFNNNQVSCP